MKIIIGLGNPGEKYQANRHNVGFMVVEQLAQRLGQTSWKFNKKFNAEIIQTKEYLLVKPMTFMNESGVSASLISRFYKATYTDLYVIHDDLDIALGSYKIQFGKGPQIHNGLLSIEEKLGTDQFWNVRVGVENREVRGNKGVPGVVYSLQDFSSEERLVVGETVTRIVDEMLTVLS
jgi:PTH1 family peptidyl-tRNA hydrolase